MTPTVRKYARTASEAFRDADYACSVQRPARKSIAWPLVCFASFAFIGVLLAW